MSQLSLADFDLLKLIGQGSSGLVYRAREKISGKSVALKIVKKGLSSDSRTLLEQQLHQSLSSCSFVSPLLASWHDHVNFYLVSKFCGGQDLDLNMTLDGPFSEDRARFYASELLVAFQEMKAQKILHRDIKPANILLTSQGHVRVIDFGLATKLKASPVTQFLADPAACSGSFTIHDPDFTSAERVGTPSYMSADQHIGRPYSYEADLHALGVMIFQMLTGRLPFGEGARSREEVLEAVLCEHLIFRPDDKVSFEARDLLSKLLGRDSKSPAQLEEIMYHPWFAGVRWDRVKTQATSPSWKPYLCPQPKNNNVVQAEEGAPCLPDPYPTFSYISPEFCALRAQPEGGIFSRISKLFTRDSPPPSPTTPSTPSAPPPQVDTEASPSAPPPQVDIEASPSAPPPPPQVDTEASPSAPPPQIDVADPPSLTPPPVVTSKTSSRTSSFRTSYRNSAFRASARRCPPPTPAPTIPLPPIPTEAMSSPAPKDAAYDPSAPRGDLPPLRIRQLLNQRPRLPPIVLPLRSDVTLTPEVIVTPADEDKDANGKLLDSTESMPALRAPLKEVTNQRYLSPSDAERPAFNPVVKAGPRIKLAAPPKRAKRAQKENASLQSGEQAQAKVKENAPLQHVEQVQSKAKVARTPPTAVFMLPPKSVPLPLVMPTSSPLQTPKKAAVKPKTASQPPPKKPSQAKSSKAVPSTSVTPPAASPQTPKRAALKGTCQPSPKTSPAKPSTPKVKPAFKVPAKVIEPKLGTPPGSVRRRSSVTKASTPASASATNDDAVYPRPLVRADTLAHPALAYTDTTQKPASYPRPPEAASQPQAPTPTYPLSIAEAFAPPPRSPPGPKTAPKNAPRFTSAPQACGVFGLSSEAFSPAARAGFYGLLTPRINLDPRSTKQRAGEIFERARLDAVQVMRESPYLSARPASPPITVGPHYAGYLPGPSPTGIVSQLRRLWIRLEMAVSRAVAWLRYRDNGFEQL